jgi:hypothetical protein
VRPNEPSEGDLLNRLAAIQAAAELLDDNNDLSQNDRHVLPDRYRNACGADPGHQEHPAAC